MSNKLTIKEINQLRRFINVKNFTEDAGEGKKAQIASMLEYRRAIGGAWADNLDGGGFHTAVEKYKSLDWLVLLPTQWPTLTNNPSKADFDNIHKAAKELLPWYSVSDAKELKGLFKNIYLKGMDARHLGALYTDPCYNFLRVVSGVIPNHPGVVVEPSPFKRLAAVEKDVRSLQEVIDDAKEKFGTDLVVNAKSAGGMYVQSTWVFNHSGLTLSVSCNGDDVVYSLMYSGLLRSIKHDRELAADGEVYIAAQHKWMLPYKGGVIEAVRTPEGFRFGDVKEGQLVTTKMIEDAVCEDRYDDELIVKAWMLSKTI